MTVNNQPNINVTSSNKYCPILKKNCIGRECAWYLKPNEAHLPKEECAIFVLATKTASMAR